MNQRASTSGGSLGDIINEWSTFYYGIDRFQRWRQIGNLLDWSQGNSCCYRFHYIANEPQMWNSEFTTQLRPQDPGITTVDVWKENVTVGVGIIRLLRISLLHECNIA